MKIESEHTLNNKFVENMHDAVFILDEKYNIIDCNATARRWYGYKQDEITKLNLQNLRTPDERAKINNHMQSAWEQEGATWETKHVRKDGSTFEVEVSSTPINIGTQRRFYHLVRDINERKKSENELRVLEERYHKLIDLSPDAIFVHRDEKIIFMNSAGLKLFGATSPEQIIGKSLWMLYPEDRHEIVRNRNNTMLQTKEIAPLIEHTVLRLDGKPLTVEATARMIDYEEKPAIYVILRDITARKKAEEELHYVSKYDVVTDLPNRRMFEEHLKAELDNAQKMKQSVAVLFMEINNFNFINEAIGHPSGDQLLREVSQRLIELGLSRDSLARFSTDEFAIAIKNITDLNQIDNLAAQIQDALSKVFTIDDQKINISINIGASVYPENSQDLNSLLKSVSIALSTAKEIGVGTVQLCTAEMAERATRRIRLEADLRDALDQNQFFLNYQPIVDSRDTTVIGVEALIRWKTASALVSPAEFIPLAEKTHLIIPIGEWVLRTACTQGVQWQAVAPLIISVNISPVQFKYVDIIQLLTRVLAETGLPASCLKIEVTEGVLMDNIKQSISTLSKVKNMGIKISIDDFGTGYSSLNYLRHLPVDYLKIDQSFVRNITEDVNDAAIVKTIIDLAGNLGYKTIAEGVETKEQLVALTNLGCHEIQGYYYSRPVGADAITTMLKTTI